MSNIYVQEPPTAGKVVLTTSLGEIEIELWSKECPKACRNFVQLCLEGYYDGTIFHRVVPNFIAQGGDPSGTGHGGESVYGEPFKNEVHSRIRFVRRGLVATANTGNNDNESQFFFTLGSCPELQNKHTIFGKVGGNTLFNMIKFNDLDIDREDRPNHPPKILKTEVINNPFPDIEPRVDLEAEKKKEEASSKSKVKGTKNLKLLSFGEEEEEEENIEVVPKFKGKSSHDLTNDPTLSAVPAVEVDEKAVLREKEHKESLERIQSKLQKKSGKEQVELKPSTSDAHEEYANSDDERKQAAKDKLDSIKAEIKSLKRNMKKDKDGGNQDDAKKPKTDSVPSEDDEEKSNEVLKDFHEQQKKYAIKKQTLPAKGTSRELETLARLKQFQERLLTARQAEPTPQPVAAEEEEDKGDAWLGHTLKFEDPAPVLARDANTKGDDWFDIYDPRNPLNKRKREESKKTMKERGSSSKKNDL